MRGGSGWARVAATVGRGHGTLLLDLTRFLLYNSLQPADIPVTKAFSEYM